MCEVVLCAALKLRSTWVKSHRRVCETTVYYISIFSLDSFKHLVCLFKNKQKMNILDILTQLYCVKESPLQIGLCQSVTLFSILLLQFTTWHAWTQTLLSEGFIEICLVVRELMQQTNEHAQTKAKLQWCWFKFRLQISYWSPSLHCGGWSWNSLFVCLSVYTIPHEMVDEFQTKYGTIKQFVGVLLQIIFWSQPNTNWLPQIINLSKHKVRYNSVNFEDTELIWCGISRESSSASSMQNIYKDC